MPSQVHWSKLNEFLAQVGAFDDPMSLAVNTLLQLRKLVLFDQGRIYFLDADGKVFDEYLVGVSKKVTKDYHGYYSEVDGDRYSATKRAKEKERAMREQAMDESLPKGRLALYQRIYVVDWSQEPHDTRFYREHVAPQGIRHSTGLALHDAEGRTRALFCLDRTHDAAYSRDDTVMLGLVATHVDNMFRKLYTQAPSVRGDQIAMLTGESGLTERERQVCTLLVRGMSPKAIAEMFGLSVRTVYKHVQNIHEKLGVSSQLELVAKLSE